MNTNITPEKFKELVERIEELKKGKAMDLSLDEDLSIALMNLISLEEHFYFTSQKTGKDEYLEMLKDTREIRKQLLAQMMPNNEGETWCISKHLLATTMRMIEVGTKLLGSEQKEEAEKMFARAYKVYSMFWALKLSLVSLADIKNNEVTNIQQNKPMDFEDIMNKLVDCCKE